MGKATPICAKLYQQHDGTPNELPRGPWIETAKNYTFQNYRLSADLQTNDGSYTHDSIAANKWTKLQNNNGHFIKM